MKKILLSIFILLSLSAKATDKHYQGDINNDGKLDLTDLMMLSEAVKTGSSDMDRFDINHTGSIDKIDMQTLAQWIIDERLMEESGINVGIGGWDEDEEDYGGVVGAPALRGENELYSVQLSPLTYDPATGITSVSIDMVPRSDLYAYLVDLRLPANFEPGQLNLSLPESDNLLTAYSLKSASSNQRIDKIRFLVLSYDLTPLEFTVAPTLSYDNVSCSGTINAINCQVGIINETSARTLSDSSIDFDFEYRPVQGITLSESSHTLYLGDSFSLSASVRPENATDKTIAWSSSNTDIATVDADGKVTAIGFGTAEITAKCGEVSAVCTVTVVPTPAGSIILSRETAQLRVGESITLTATVLPETTTDKTVTWTSSNESVATVDTNGKVTAVGLGEAEIIAKCGEVSATCKVTVIATAVESISISQTTVTLRATEVVQLTATVLPETATDKSIMWSTSDATVATVSETGLVTALDVGQATITATASSGVKADCKVTVEATPAESVMLSQSAASLKVGESLVLTATVLPETTTDKTVTWTSSNESVATVDTNGKVTAVGLGEAEITARCSEVSAGCEVSVLPILVESITLTPDTWSGMEGDFIQLVAVVLPEDATDKSLNWTSSDEHVATVDNNGLVTIQTEGSCVITVTAADGSGIEAKCIVTGFSGIEAIYADSDATVDVYGLGGRLLKKACNKSQLQHLAPGIYILRNGQKVVKAIVK